MKLIYLILFLLSNFLYAQGIGPKFTSSEVWKKSKTWKPIIELIEEQKFNKAQEKTNDLLKEYTNSKDEKNWALALIMNHNLTQAQHKIETATENFKDAKWPKSLSTKMLLSLYYAQSLQQYYRYYSWEINKREKIVSKKKYDLKKWTKDELFSEIHRTLVDIWKIRKQLKKTKTSYLTEFIQEGNYPREVRGTIRDALSYFFVSFLQDTTLWSAQHSNETNLIALEDLIETDAKYATEKSLLDPKIHPFYKITAILNDLEKWHWSEDRISALLEARFEKIRIISSRFQTKENSNFLLSHLKAFIKDYSSDKWWSEGMFLMATIKNKMTHPTAKIEALQLAEKGASEHQGMPAQRCKALANQIKFPELGINVINHDLFDKRSIEVTYKNWNKIYFRAYQFDPAEFLLKQKNYNMRPDQYKILDFIKGKEIKSQWNASLEDIKDYRSHRAFVNIPIKEYGYYIILASGNESFSENKNKILTTYFNRTDMNIMSGTIAGKNTIRVHNAKTGALINDAEIIFYQLDWKNGHKFYKKMKTDKGIFTLTDKNLKNNKSYVYIVQNGKDKFYNLNNVRVRNNYDPGVRPVSLVFTDRSIYRPKQKIHFKTLVFDNYQTKNKLPKIKKNVEVTVDLMDMNYKKVETLKVKTNKFGSASGEFIIPEGRALGQWHIRTNYNGKSYIKVEEYKRPTFLTELLEAKKQVRLNHKATFSGHANYYFGLPLKHAQVKWKIARRIRYPFWYSWRYGAVTNGNSQIVASGITKTDEKGTYEISFTPRAPKDQDHAEIVYSYNIEAEVLNEGGETAKTNKIFSIGSVAVTASLSQKSKFITPKDRVDFTVVRTDLNGKALSGTGKWTVYKLIEPKKTLAPSEQPLYYNSKFAPDKKYQSKGDYLRTRWSGLVNNEHILQSWQQGKKITSAGINHDKDGVANIEIDSLKAGAYRLVYSTEDDFGFKFNKEHNFLVLGPKKSPKLPLVMRSNKDSVYPGENLKLFIGSGQKDLKLYFDLYHMGKKITSKVYSGGSAHTYKMKISKKHQGGLKAIVYTVYDNHPVEKRIDIAVPRDQKNLVIGLERIRKKMYPGVKQNWTVKLKSKNSKGKVIKLQEQAEVLSYMYDKSLDVFTDHTLSRVDSYYPLSPSAPYIHSHVSSQYGYSIRSWSNYMSTPHFVQDRILVLANYGIGGPGHRGGLGSSNRFLKKSGYAKRGRVESLAPMSAMESKQVVAEKEEVADIAADEAPGLADDTVKVSSPKKQIRSNFNETAFFKPHLLTSKNGEVKLEFTAPDSLTAWKLWVMAITEDLDFGIDSTTIESVKDLMLRSYLPRFFRQGDEVDLKLVVDNAGKVNLSGTVHVEIISDKGKSLGKSFELDAKYTKGQKFSVKKGESQSFNVKIKIPYILGNVKIKAYAKTKQFTDGEEKSLPILPSRIHLAQSKFTSLDNKETRTLNFEDMLKEDKTRINDSLVVRVDGQLFYSVLSALPYLVDYPYECTEQSLNKFLTTGILDSTYKKYPSVSNMAQKMSERKTQFEAFDGDDPNRKMNLIETPWLNQSQGGSGDNKELLNMLRPGLVKTQKLKSMKKLKEAQTSSGGFPWFAGGPPSYHITAYIVYGFAKAQEFGIEIPKRMSVKAWQYIHSEYRKSVDWCMSHNSCWEMITYINFILSSYKDMSYTGDIFSESERVKMLDFSFKHWKSHSPQLKAMLALTLHRFKRSDDAKLVFDSILDTAKNEKDLGTYWAPEDRSWLWYNDTIETHAFILKAMLELQPKNELRHGLVKWLFLNKKLNHWKSTKATAEVMYSLIHYMEQEGLIDSDQSIDVKIGEVKKSFEFVSDEYTGKANFVVIGKDQIKEKEMHKIDITQKTKGMAFASATWHYSTEQLPESARGDFFKVTRKFYLRTIKDNKMELRPISEGEKIKVGDEVEIHLSITSKHAAEYVQLMDPRPAGFEPEFAFSGYKWDLGLTRYQEIRDSGVNFFFEKLPVGEYTLKHRIRANLSGRFRTAPTTLQSVYAPEFRAFSSGKYIEVLK